LPVGALRKVQVCIDDGYLASSLCEVRDEWLPVASHFDRQTPYHQRVHLDSRGRYRVDSHCEAVAAMRHENRLVLPPTMEIFYRRGHADYQPLPPWRADCRRGAAEDAPHLAMEFLYPGPSGRIFIPVELDGQRGRVVLEVAHREPEKRLFWHLNESFLGETQLLHQKALDVMPGRYTVTVVDQEGRRIARSFEVLKSSDSYTEEK
jgi:penicillin-binding protein 1C